MTWRNTRAIGEQLRIIRNLSDVIIRGSVYRFELKEVRLYLEAFPKISQAVAMMLEDSLVALVTLKTTTEAEEQEEAQDETQLVTEIREHLHHLLPHYMIPREFVFLAHIPTLANGRIDRQQLQLALPLKPSLRRTTSIGSEIGTAMEGGREGEHPHHHHHRNPSSPNPSNNKTLTESLFCCFSAAAVEEPQPRGSQDPTTRISARR